MATSICIHPVGGRWEEVEAKSYGDDISLEFRDKETRYALSVFKGEQDIIELIESLALAVEALRRRLSGEYKTS